MLEKMCPGLGSYCPHVVYLYFCEEISGLVSRAVSPQMLATPLNCDAINTQCVAEEKD